MAFTKDDEAKRACYKILSDLPQGDTKALMAKISSIEAFPDNKSVSVKPIINKLRFELDSTQAEAVRLQFY